MCETCGRHCNSWEWETSGYAVLNGSELDMATLIWRERLPAPPSLRHGTCTRSEGSGPVGTWINARLGFRRFKYSEDAKAWNV